jgi:DNA-binding MarR family transcriptional regulator
MTYSSYLCDRTFKDSSEVTSIFRVLRRRCWGDIIQVLDAIAYSKQASGKDYHNGWIKIEQSKLASKTNYTRSYLSTQILELQAVGLLELRRKNFECYCYKFTSLAKEIFSAIARLEYSKFAEIKSLVRGVLHQLSAEFSRFTAAPAEQIVSFWSQIRESLMTVIENSKGDVQLSTYKQNPFQNPFQNNQLTNNEVADVVTFSVLSHSHGRETRPRCAADKENTDTLETPSSEPTPTQPLAKSEILEETNFPAAHDKLKPKAAQEKRQEAERKCAGGSFPQTPSLGRRQKGEPTDDCEGEGNITKPSALCPRTSASCDYQIELAAIGVAVQNVDWVIRQIPKSERDRVVAQAIAWISEQKWVEQPAAAFVNAVRGRKRSARAVDVELRQIIDTHQTEAQQFSQWYAIAKRRGRVDYSQGDKEHYALVTLPDGVTMPWHQARDYLAVLMAADDELEAKNV